jgi:Fe-S-cluster containining protein
MKNDIYFKQCCQECDGKCCQPGGLYITKPEYDKLPKKYKEYFKKHFYGYHIKLGGQCPFLNKGGCILGENRFLECKLYPLEVITIDKLFLRKECPFRSKFDNDEYMKRGMELLEEYKNKELFSQKDVVSILNNPYPKHFS